MKKPTRKSLKMSVELWLLFSYCLGSAVTGIMVYRATHINAIGSFKDTQREVDDLTIKKAKIFVDSRSLCLKEAGDLIIPIKKGILKKTRIKGELGDLVLHRQKGRESKKEITLFKSVGLGVQDMAVCKSLYEKAEEKNLGQKLKWM